MLKGETEVHEGRTVLLSLFPTTNPKQAGSRSNLVLRRKRPESIWSMAGVCLWT